MATDTLTAAAPDIDLMGQRPPEQQAQLLARMRKQFASAAEYESQQRQEMVEDLAFRAGQQWDPQQERARLAAGRPCLTVNTLPQYEHQITNELRQSPPALNVLPVGNGADQDTAKTLKGIVRHIDQASHGHYVRQIAFESAVRIGMGFYRIVLEYDAWNSFDQEPRLAAIRNPFMVYLDPLAQHPAGKDAAWAFVFEHQDREAFQDEWQIDARSLDMWSSQGDHWVWKDHVRVAEYFWHDRTRMTLAQMQDGSVTPLEPALLADARQLDNPLPLQRFVAHLCTPRPRSAPLLPWMQQQVRTAPQWLDGLPPSFVQEYATLVAELVQQIRQVRPTEYDTVRWVKTNGYQILEESIWPGKSIPLIRVVGEEVVVDGKIQRAGLPRYAKDPMRMENYWLTMQAEHIALSPVPPWLIAVGQVEGFEDIWASANRVPRAYLPYQPTDVKGNTVPPPIRNAYEPPVQAITVAMTMTQQYTQNAMGMYHTNVGAPNQKEKSGRAIQAKDEQSDTGNFHYVDNLAISMKVEGEQLIELIPKVLTPGKIQRILGDDGSPQMVQLVSSAQGMPPPQQLQQGIAGMFDLDVGTYDIRVEVGPSYATKRQEAAAQMLELTRAMPEAMQAVLYKIVGTMDWEGASELAELLKQLPGQILDNPETNKDTQLAQLRQQIPQLMQQLQQLNAYGKQMEQALQQLVQENKTLKEAHDLKLLEIQVQRDEVQIRAQAEVEKALIERQKVEIDRQRAEADAKSRAKESDG